MSTLESRAAGQAVAAFRGDDGPGRYLVSFRGESEKYFAANRTEAWAMFCDDLKNWPSPKSFGIRIQKLS